MRGLTGDYCYIACLQSPQRTVPNKISVSHIIVGSEESLLVWHDLVALVHQS